MSSTSLATMALLSIYAITVAIAEYLDYRDRKKKGDL